MRAQAERREQPLAKPMTPPDSSHYPRLSAQEDDAAAVDAASAWLAHIDAGRITVR